MRASRFLILLLGLALAGPAPAGAVCICLVDTFDTDTEGWISGSPNPTPPSRSAAGGPDGGPFLSLESRGGFGAGSKLVAINVSQWTGDYLAAGVSGIQMDVNNTGSEPLELRMAFNSGGSWVASADGISVAAGSGWQTVLFPLGIDDLDGIGGADPASVLADVDQVRLLHVLVPFFQGTPIEATLGVDNIAAVPEPSTLLLAGLGLAALGAFRGGRARV